MPKVAATTVTPVENTGPSSKVLTLRLGVLGLLGLGLFVLYQVVWTLVSIGIGSAILAGLSLGSVVIFKMLPLLAQKLENRILAARKAEARSRPIEQLQNFKLSKAKQTEAFGKAVSLIGAQVKSLEDMIADRKQRRPGSDVSKQEEALAQMKQAHKGYLRKYEAAVAALSQLDEVIEEQRFKFQFAQASQTAMASLNATSGQNLLDSMLAGEAFSSVRDQFNKAFADLEVDARRLNEADKLEFGGQVIDMSNVEIPQLEPVNVRTKARK